MELSGKILLLLPLQTGNGRNGTWKKQDFVIETVDNFPKKVCLSAWGDKIDLNRFKPGQAVKVFFDIESREYNGRWYTDLKAFNLQPAQGADAANEVDDVNIPDQDDLPF